MGASVVNKGYYDIPINNQYSNKELPRNREQIINESNFNKIINNKMNNNKQNYILEPSNMGVYQDPSSLSFDSKIPLLKKKEQVCNYVNNQNIELFSNSRIPLSVNHNNYADRDYLNSQFIPNVNRNYWQDNDPSYSPFQSISEPENVFNNFLPNTCNTCEPSVSKYNRSDLSYNRGMEGYNQNSNQQNNNSYNDFKLPTQSNVKSQINNQFNLPISRNIDSKSNNQFNLPISHNIDSKSNNPIFINQKDIKRDLKKYIKVESKVRENIEPLTKIGEPLSKVGGNKLNNKKRIKSKRLLKKNNKKNKEAEKDFSKDTLWNIIYGLTFIILLFIIKFLYDSKIFNKIN